MKKSLFLTMGIAFCAILGLGFVTNYNNDPVAILVAKFDKVRTENPQEKVHIHMDKPFYAIGDDIWFKAYIVNAEDNRLSNLSKIFYVELITPDDSVAKSLRLPVIAGLCAGNFNLSDSLPIGNYRIRAYTKLMLNNPEFIFDRTFRVGNARENEIITNITYSFSNYDEKSIVTAEILYANLNGEPFRNGEVNYNVQINKKIISKGSGKTDFDGRLKIVFNTNGEQLFNYGEVNTYISKEGHTTKHHKSFPIKAISNNVDVQFFPESGQQIVNTRSKMGFKAVGADGLGVDVNGYIIDKDNNQIVEFKSDHSGMGSFTFGPESGNEYRAVIKFSDGTEKQYNLPKALDSGYSLMVNNNNPDSINVRIIASPDLINNNKVVLIGQSNSVVNYVAELVLKGSPTIIKIPKNKLPLGLLQLSLFSLNQPVAERLLFIRKDHKLNISINTDKKIYAKKEKVNMNFKVTDEEGNPVQTLFSLSVTDFEKVPIKGIDEQTIFSNLLLTSDVKGYVEKPNYYFVDVDENKNRHLDNLLITQGWTRFNLKTILTEPLKPLIYNPETSLSVSGQVVTLGGKPLPGARVTLLTSAGKGLLLDTIADNDGRFNFDRLLFEEKTKFVVQAKNSKDKKYNVEILLDPVPKATIVKNKNSPDIEINIDNSLLTYLMNSKKEYEELIRLGLIERRINLSEVVIVEEKKNPANDDFFAIGTESQAIGAAKFQDCADILQCIQTLVPGVLIQENMVYLPRNISSRLAMGIIIDGILVDSDYLVNLSPQDVESMRVYKDFAGIGIMGGSGRGNISITTRRGGGGINMRYTPNVKMATPSGLSTIKQFYSPKYDDPKTDPKTQDLRSTIYWSPQILTNKDGLASIEFFNADGNGTYRTVVEGLSPAGKLLRETYTYTVK